MNTRRSADANELIVVPDEIVEKARRGVGAFFESIGKIDGTIFAQDFLDVQKSIACAERLDRVAPIKGRKLLEIGAGYGTNVVVWLKRFGADAYAVEPDGEGFESAFSVAQELLKANDCDPTRIVNAGGEKLPFDDESFDVVYSSNVLEHTQEPLRVVEESVRVLRPGGTLFFEFPNYLSYFEGHYFVFKPPIVWKPILPFWVRYVCGRDPKYAHTLRTELNPAWCRRAVRHVNTKYPVELVTLGEEAFLERLKQPFEFEMQTVARRAGRVVGLIQRLNYSNWIGRTIVATQAYYPMLLTLRRL